ncbi:MAG: hypothetical protein Q4D91_05630 [Lautropia sp.]|nr:hypothetical protein [Lautropia sp.]
MPLIRGPYHHQELLVHLPVDLLFGQQLGCGHGPLLWKQGVKASLDQGTLPGTQQDKAQGGQQ